MLFFEKPLRFGDKYIEGKYTIYNVKKFAVKNTLYMIKKESLMKLLQKDFLNGLPADHWFPRNMKIMTTMKDYAYQNRKLFKSDID
jgi:hypothetical protein